MLITLRGLQYGTRVHTHSSLPCPALLLDRSSSKAKQSTALKTSQSLIKSLSTLCLSISQSVRPSSGSSGRPPTSQPVNQAAIDRFINQFIRRCTRSLTQSLNFSTTLIQPESPLSGLLCSLHPSLIFSRTARPHLACILHLAHLASIQSNPVQSSPGPIQSNPIRPSPHPPPFTPLLPQINSLRQKPCPTFYHTHAHTHTHTHHSFPSSTTHTVHHLPTPATDNTTGSKTISSPLDRLRTHCLKYLRDHGKATLCLSENNPSPLATRQTPSNLVPTPALLADPAVDLHLAQSTANPSFAATSCFVAQHLLLLTHTLSATHSNILSLLLLL